jgi:hypothetical protein
MNQIGKLMRVNRHDIPPPYQPEDHDNYSGTEANKSRLEQPSSSNARTYSDQHDRPRTREGSGIPELPALKNFATLSRSPVMPEIIENREKKLSNLRADIHSKYERLESIKAARAAENLPTNSELASNILSVVAQGSVASATDQAEKPLER